jgi:drug/metabolite transporter (DMT)-like permease
MKTTKLLIFAAVVCTSASSIFIRLNDMPPLVIAFYRMFIATAVLGVPLLRSAGFADFRKLIRKDIMLCLFSGVALAGHFATWIASLSYTSVAASTTLVSLSPIFVTVINAIFFRQKPGKIFVFSLMLTFAGTLVISMGASGDGMSFVGNMMALAGALFMAIYLMIGQQVRKRLGLTIYVFLVYGFSAIVLFILCISTGQQLSSYATWDFVNVALMALVCSVGGHTLYNMLIKYQGAVTISLVTLCEPVFASLLALAILSELPMVTTIIGGILVLCGVMIYVIRQHDVHKNV